MLKIGHFSIFEIIGILAILGALAFLVYTLYKKYTKIFIAVVATAVLSIIAITLLADKPEKFFKKTFSPKKPPVHYFYDTDPRNDTFIKGNLEPNKLARLDKILILEKKNDSMALPANELLEAAHYDLDLVDAYQRWTKCKNMRRSYHQVVYPDERSKVKSQN